MSKEEIKIIANNKKAYHEFFIEEKLEVGISLVGTEVKSLRLGKCNLKDSYVEVQGGSLFVRGMHISPYEKGNIFNRDPLRVRRLLLHKEEIRKLLKKVNQQGYTIVPLSCYFKGSLVKLEIALAKGKKLYDKRETEAAKSAARDMDRTIKERNH